MYKNLLAEIAREGKKRQEVAKEAGMGPVTLSEKLNGKRDFKLSEMIALRKAINAEDLTLDFLFERDEAEG